MLILPTIAELHITKDQVIAQSFGSAKLELYEGAVECIRQHLRDFVVGALVEFIDDYEVIYGDFEWNDETAISVATALPAVSTSMLEDNVVGQPIGDETHRATVAYTVAGELVHRYRPERGGEGRFLAQFGIVAADWEGGSAPPIAGESLPAPIVPKPTVAAGVAPGSGEVLGAVMKSLADICAIDKPGFAKGMDISEGSVNNYLSGRNAPKKFTPEQRAFLLATIDYKASRLAELAQMVSA